MANEVGRLLAPKTTRTAMHTALSYSARGGPSLERRKRRLGRCKVLARNGRERRTGEETSGLRNQWLCSSGGLGER